MPFMHKQKIENIDRSKKVDISIISQKMSKCIDELFMIFRDSGNETHYFRLLPVFNIDPKFADANPKNFLVLYAKTHGLDLYEIEYWLDNVRKIDPDMHYLLTQPMSMLYLDKRRMYYTNSNSYGLPINSILYRP